MSLASQFQFAVRKLSFVCHDCSETRGVICQQSLNDRARSCRTAKNSSHTGYKERFTINTLVPTVIHANSSVYLGNSHPRMLNTTWKRGTIVDKRSRYTFRPNGSKIHGNLLRTRKCFTTSHMHIYSIPPMSRMNFAQKRVPKLFCSDFIPVFSFSVETTFFGNDNQLPNFLNSNTVLKYQIEERSM